MRMPAQLFNLKRDIDLVLLEELSTSEEFCDWLDLSLQPTSLLCDLSALLGR